MTFDPVSSQFCHLRNFTFESVQLNLTKLTVNPLIDFHWNFKSQVNPDSLQLQSIKKKKERLESWLHWVVKSSVTISVGMVQFWTHKPVNHTTLNWTTLNHLFRFGLVHHYEDWYPNWFKPLIFSICAIFINCNTSFLCCYKYIF